MEVVCAKDVSSYYFTASGVLIKGGCWFYGVQINAEAGGKAILRLFNGSDSVGELKLEITAQADGHRVFKPCFPVYFSYGLYVQAVQNLRSGFIQVLAE